MSAEPYRTGTCHERRTNHHDTALPPQGIPRPGPETIRLGACF